MLRTLMSVSAAAAIALTAFAVSAPVNAASHALSPEEAHAVRVDAMKKLGGTMRTLGGLTDQQAMVDAANIYVETFASMADWFPEGSGVGEVEGSLALPAIWDKPDEFAAEITKAQEAAAALLAAAEAGDTATFASAPRSILGPVCGECHMSFRQNPQQ